MKLKLSETIEQSQTRLIARTKKPSFDNGKGLTKIQQFMILDSIELLQNILNGESSSYPTNQVS